MNTTIIAGMATSTAVSTQSLSECLKTTMGFYGSTITNICNGAINYIPNGFWDYVIGSILFLVPIVLLTIFLKVIFD